MLSIDYIVGLTDGEGSFTAYVRPPRQEHQSKSWRVECHFYLKMREDELPLLKEVKKFFDCGRLSFQRDGRRNHRSCYRFEISDIANIKEKVIPLFKEHSPCSVNRKNDFKLFCRILALVERRAQQSKTGLATIIRLKARMHQ